MQSKNKNSNSCCSVVQAVGGWQSVVQYGVVMVWYYGEEEKDISESESAITIIKWAHDVV